MSDIQVWHPVAFSANWENGNAFQLERIFPSWQERRKTLKENVKEYREFVESLKREHAIETGIVERLYDLKEGITETFIKNGFVESYLQHGDTNISPGLLMHYLHDNFEAIDFVFDVVKNNRPLTKSFIKELHHLITSHQDFTEGIDSLGRKVIIPLLKGSFKEHANNPRRKDGKLFIYCPPVHVEAEVDRLLQIYEELLAKKTSPVIIAAWFHHAFTQIHPFQDGNGRIARLLASLILIRFGLFLFTVKRTDTETYINALELADKSKPQSLIIFFIEIQKRYVEAALQTIQGLC